MESAEVPPSSQQEIPSKPEAGQENSEPTTALSSMAAANQPDNETVAMIKTPQSLEGDQSVDGKGEVPMDTSLTKEETESKKELVADQENTTPPDMQEGNAVSVSDSLTSEGEKRTPSSPQSVSAGVEKPASLESSTSTNKATDNSDELHTLTEAPATAAAASTKAPPPAPIAISQAPPTAPPTAPPSQAPPTALHPAASSSSHAHQQQQLSKGYSCRCGRNFDTQRGLSMHWAHEKDHKPAATTMTSSSEQQQAGSEPTSPQVVSPSPLHSPTSAPDSPTFNMASFKTSARNPQYYSIIRTRRSSEHHSSSSSSTVEVGTKRPRGSSGTSTTPPAKAMQLNTGEKVPVVGEGEEESEKESSEAAAATSSLQKRRSRDKETKKEQQATLGQQRPRTRSLSSSDNTSPPLKSSLSVPGEVGSNKGGPRSSPVTRSNAATLKKHEFVSLPARRRRGGGRGRGRGRGGGGVGRGQESMEEEREDAVMETDDNESQSEEPTKEEVEPPQEPPPPAKRRRGRPPKNKAKDAPSSGASKSAPSSTQTTPNQPTSSSSSSATAPTSSSTKQTRFSGRGGGRGGGRAAMERDSVMDEQEENPLNIKGSKLPPWESETDKPTSTKHQQSSKASTPSSEQPANLPTSNVRSSKSDSSTKDSKTKSSVDSNHSDSAAPPPTQRRVRKKASTSVDNSKGESTEVMTESVAEVEKEIKTRSKAKGSRKPSESQSDKDTPPSASPAAQSKEDEADKKEKEREEKEPATVTSRPSSVIVSVLSGPETKGAAASSGSSSNGSASEEQKQDQNQSTSSSSSQADEKAAANGGDAQQFKHESVPPMMGYPPPPTSAPTPTYPYPYTGGPYAHPSIMYPPGPASSMYPYYYHPGSAGSQPPPMMPHPYLPPTGMPPPPVMMPSGEQQAGTGTGLPSPHHAINPFQFQTTAPSPNGPSPNTTAMAMTSAGTTVGGVRVTLLDKPPTQMPTVTVPHPNVSRSHPSPTSVYPGHNPMTDHVGNPTSPMGQVPLIRPPYIPSPGAHSPEGIQPHPLSQVYRMSQAYPAGPLPHPHQPHYHHPAHPHLAVRFDPTGHPYMNWEPKPPPPEEQPAQPVECPECGRMFKNNKALNGHMRLHGGFDWTKRPFVEQKQSSSSNTDSTDSDKGKGGKASSTAAKKESRSRSRSRSKSPAPSASSVKQAAKRRTSSEDKSGVGSKDVKLEGLPVPRAPNVFTFDTKDHHHASSRSHAHHHHHGNSGGGMHDAGTMTFSNQQSAMASSHRSAATLDDLVRAAEELERIENGNSKEHMKSQVADVSNSDAGSDVDEAGRRRPKNITIPHSSHSNPSPAAIDRERHRFGATPPYTPPPILSPSRSLTMLATAAGGGAPPCTPSRILHPWSSRRSSEGQKPSESEDVGYTEPRINIGRDFQAVLPECSSSHAGAVQDDYQATRVWDPLKDLTHEDESIMDGYLQLACSPAVLYGGRNMELAYHFLYQLGGSVKEAVRVLLSGKSLFPEGNPMTTYNYCGSKRWSGKERQQFRRAWRVHRKQFQLLRSAVDSKTFQDVTEFYYTWKKYCSDEYRGRNRHTSEEILSDEDNAYPQVPSSGSSASVENDHLEGGGGEMDQNYSAAGGSKGDRHRNTSKNISQATAQQAYPPTGGQLGGYHGQRHSHGPPNSGGQNPMQQHHIDYDSFPVVYSAHKHGQIHQYKCKYPGCNQVFTSIFALNGHIRVHGGSFYPRPSSGSSSGSSSASSSSHHHTSSSAAGTQGSPYSSKGHQHGSSSSQQKLSSSYDSRSPQQLDIAKALLDLPGGSRSPARGGPFSASSSQKSSPSKSRSPATTKKKMSSSSPGEREGYYPCNRCGRVFTKVKSRSAHMKSHIIKQN